MIDSHFPILFIGKDLSDILILEFLIMLMMHQSNYLVLLTSVSFSVGAGHGVTRSISRGAY